MKTNTETRLRRLEEASAALRPNTILVVEKLGDVEYFYQRGGRRIAKRVSFFLFEYVSGDPAEHDHEIEEARWVPLEEAARTLTYKGERDMVARALSRRASAR